ncbi:hypothetical protein Salat_1813600 [Sesamum alatum]|uniref:Uncharacterized protein n=1 Tax=Sesamum alatum TaxID=300844 RepID=A0AAE2CHG6_9LAMI|nr:hypothetical protein Salat_1813600 [Sesamum alatum]
MDLMKERVTSAGLLDHGFKAKALMKEDLLIVAGLHPVEDTYSGSESRYSRLHNFSGEYPLESSFPFEYEICLHHSLGHSIKWERSFSFGDSLERPPQLIVSQPYSFSARRRSAEPPVIEVVTSPENDLPQMPLSQS